MRQMPFSECETQWRSVQRPRVEQAAAAVIATQVAARPLALLSKQRSYQWPVLPDMWRGLISWQSLARIQPLYSSRRTPSPERMPLAPSPLGEVAPSAVPAEGFCHVFRICCSFCGVAERASRRVMVRSASARVVSISLQTGDEIRVAILRLGSNQSGRLKSLPCDRRRRDRRGSGSREWRLPGKRRSIREA